jgi:hypothetical protein
MPRASASILIGHRAVIQFPVKIFLKELGRRSYVRGGPAKGARVERFESIDKRRAQIGEFVSTTENRDTTKARTIDSRCPPNHVLNVSSVTVANQMERWHGARCSLVQMAVRGRRQRADANQHSSAEPGP